MFWYFIYHSLDMQIIPLVVQHAVAILAVRSRISVTELPDSVRVKWELKDCSVMNV